MNYLETIENEASGLWKKFIKADGITKAFGVKDFYAEMQLERGRVTSIIESGLLCSSTVAGLFTPGAANYFILNDLASGGICEKCGSSGIVVLLMDQDYDDNLDEKVFLPSYETYYACKIDPKSSDFMSNFPVPINHNTDYWYCPYCNEVHKFNYSDDFGLEYDQEVLDIKVDLEAYTEQANKTIAEMIDGFRLF